MHKAQLKGYADFSFLITMSSYSVKSHCLNIILNVPRLIWFKGIIIIAFTIQLFSTVTTKRGREKRAKQHRTGIALRIKDPSLLSDQDRARLFIGHCDKNGRVRRVGAALEGDFVKATVWGFGDYAIFMDTIKPTIRSIGFRYDSRRRSKFRFVIDDNIPMTRSAGVLRFRGELLIFHAMH